MNEIPHNIIVLINQLCTTNCYQEAFDVYVYGFQKYPQMKKLLEHDFRNILAKLSKDMSDFDHREELFFNFERAMCTFPGHVDILSDIGNHLNKYGYYTEALCHYEKALQIDSNLVTVEKNLNKAKRIVFPMRQFRLLNDKTKNEAYRSAIRNSITPNKDVVMDIDTGVGLLALYSEECQPVTTNACESSTVIFKMAERVFEDNHAQVVMINAPCAVLKRYDLYGDANVLLTDKFDCGLIGDYVLQTLSHAMTNLLHDPMRVIPGRAEYFIAGVECEDINKKYQLCQTTKRVLNIEEMDVHKFKYHGKSYRGEDVHLFDVKHVCEPRSLFKIDFNNHFDIQKMLHTSEPLDVTLTANERGEVNAVIGWFNLHLTEDIVITNDPRSGSRANAWQQAVFFDVPPKYLQANETMDLQFMTRGGRLTCLANTEKRITRISTETLTFLNDTVYMNEIVNCVGAACIYLGQTADVSELDIVDLNPFPVFGLLMLNRGANTLICHAETDEDKSFLVTVLKANNIDVTKVTILSDYCHSKVFERRKFHAVFMSLIDLSGDMDTKTMKLFKRLKRQLHRGGLCLPSKLSIIGQLINSDQLEVNNRVFDTNVSGYSMAQYVNRFQVSQVRFVDIATLEYSMLSEPIVIAPSCTNMNSALVKFPVIAEGECTGILCWYKVQLLDNWRSVYTNRSNSFVDCTAFMAEPKVTIFCGDEVNVLRCVDYDGAFKLSVDVET